MIFTSRVAGVRRMCMSWSWILLCHKTIPNIGMPLFLWCVLYRAALSTPPALHPTPSLPHHYPIITSYSLMAPSSVRVNRERKAVHPSRRCSTPFAPFIEFSKTPSSLLRWKLHVIMSLIPNLVCTIHSDSRWRDHGPSFWTDFKTPLIGTILSLWT